MDWKVGEQLRTSESFWYLISIINYFTCPFIQSVSMSSSWPRNLIFMYPQCFLPTYICISIPGKWKLLINIIKAFQYRNNDFAKYISDNWNSSPMRVQLLFCHISEFLPFSLERCDKYLVLSITLDVSMGIFDELPINCSERDFSGQKR